MYSDNTKRKRITVDVEVSFHPLFGMQCKEIPKSSRNKKKGKK